MKTALILLASLMLPALARADLRIRGNLFKTVAPAGQTPHLLQIFITDKGAVRGGILRKKSPNDPTDGIYETFGVLRGKLVRSSYRSTPSRFTALLRATIKNHGTLKGRLTITRAGALRRFQLRGTLSEPSLLYLPSPRVIITTKQD